MYIFPKEGNAFANSDNIEWFSVICDEFDHYSIMADEHCLGSYTVESDAIKELESIFRQLEIGSTSYQVT